MVGREVLLRVEKPDPKVGAPQLGENLQVVRMMEQSAWTECRSKFAAVRSLASRELKETGRRNS